VPAEVNADMSVGELLVRVGRKTVEAMDINSYELVSIDGKLLPAFEAGSHVDVHLPNGLTRQYSLCGELRHGEHYRIAVLREPNTRGGSGAMHHQVSEGDTLRISKPRNLFPLNPEKGASLLLAGGIGVTPLLAMAYQLHESKRNFELHYFVRSRNRLAFQGELMKAPFSSQVFFHIDDEPSEQTVSVESLLQRERADAHVYTCGPAGFLSHVLSTAKANGWLEERVHFESFSPVEVKGANSFEVQFRSKPGSVVVGPDETIVAAAARFGIEIPVSCEQGICGTCLTGVIDGKPDHKDMYLTDEERSLNNQLTPCCSRSLTSILVLDL
jgi:vanillate monooxygenase ferredoxin subunit